MPGVGGEFQTAYQQNAMNAANFGTNYGASALNPMFNQQLLL